MISKNVMRLNEWKGSSVWYRASCSCGGGDGHTCDIEFAIDKDFGDISMTFYQTLLWSDYYKNRYWFTRMWARIKLALKVIFTGYVELEGDFLIQGQEQIDSLIGALSEGKGKLEAWRIEFERENKHEN